MDLIGMPFSEVDRTSVESIAGWFYDHSKDGFAMSKGGVILRTNQAWCEMLGITREQAIGQTAQDIVKAEDFSFFRASAVELEERGETTFRARLNTCKPNDIWVEVSARRGADGLALIAVHDITARLRLDEERDEIGGITALLHAHAGTLTWQYSPTDELFFVDATRLPGSTSLQPVPRTVLLNDMLKRLDTESARTALMTSLRNSTVTGEQGEMEFRHIAPDGRRECYKAVWRGLRSEGKAGWRLIGMTQDNTDLSDARDHALKGQERAEEADRVKSRFLANISHEFRTPLNGVMGVLRLLQNELIQPPARKLLDQGLASAELLHAVLQDLVDLADLDTGRLALSMGKVDVRQLVGGLVELFKPEFEAKGLSVCEDIQPGALTVVADATRLRQILASLIGNAAKFTFGGSVTIRVAASEGNGAHRLRFEVEDTGIGIAPETMAQLFSTFRQADDTATRKFGGIGIGLTLSRRLANLMGGDVGGSSEVGRGSLFWVEVPAPLATQTADPQEAAPFAGLKVLVVDDNATNRLVAVKILEQFGAEAETAEDGLLAVEAVKARQFDLVLMDIQMPNMDGVDATREIRALSKPVGTLPIVAMTANVSPNQLETYEAAGMNGVIAKPVSPSTVFSEIASLFADDEPEQIYRLTYCSRPCPEILADPTKALSDILMVAYEFNGAHNITGALLFCDAWFVQTLEGPQEAIDQLYARIKADVRHEQVTLIDSGAAGGRQFSDWNMIGMIRTKLEIREFLSGIDFDPTGLSENQTLALLSSIAAMEQSELHLQAQAML
jgi:PAS domain S-box-containing protein